MSKKERTRSLNKLSTMSWESPIFKHGSGKYQNHVFDDNIPGYPGYYISKRGKSILNIIKCIKNVNFINICWV